MSNYFTGKFPGTLADLTRFLQRYTADVKVITLPGRDNPELIDLCYQVESESGEEHWILYPWGGIEIFIWDDGTVEIQRIWANDLEHWEKTTELPYRKGDESLSDDEITRKIEKVNLEKMRERWSKLAKISDALRNFQATRLPTIPEFQVKGEENPKMGAGPVEFSIPGMTLEKAHEILHGLAYKDNEPVMIVLLHEPGCLPSSL